MSPEYSLARKTLIEQGIKPVDQEMFLEGGRRELGISGGENKQEKIHHNREYVIERLLLIRFRIITIMRKPQIV